MMKKIVIGVVLLGMLGWSIYNLVFQEEALPEQEDFVNVDEEANLMQELDIGLNQGEQAPDFELETLDGESVKLSDYEGQKVFLNFWASWCPPCRAEMPDMQRFYEDSDEVEILAVNLLQTEDQMSNVHDFVDEFGLTFSIPLDENGEVASMYKIQPIPTSYLLDREGIIQQVAIGPMNYEMMVQQFDQMD